MLGKLVKRTGHHLQSSARRPAQLWEGRDESLQGSRQRRELFIERLQAQQLALGWESEASTQQPGNYRALLKTPSPKSQTIFWAWELDSTRQWYLRNNSGPASRHLGSICSSQPTTDSIPLSWFKVSHFHQILWSKKMLALRQWWQSPSW